MRTTRWQMEEGAVPSTSREGTTDLFEAMHTMRAIRRWQNRPVPDDLIFKIIDAATRAPNGGNRQPWGFIVITDDAQRAEIGRLVREELAPRIAEFRAELTTGPEPSRRRMVASALNLFENFGSAPLIVIPCLDFPPGHESADGMGAASNIYPAVQNLLLAARGVGLGGVLTTVNRRIELQLRAMLTIPANVQPVCTIPLGFPDANFGPTVRRPVQEVTHWGAWGATRPR
jgi:nitroreductase